LLCQTLQPISASHCYQTLKQCAASRTSPSRAYDATLKGLRLHRMLANIFLVVRKS